MPKTQQQRELMCAVCHGKFTPKPGQRRPDKPTACEMCTAEMKKGSQNIYYKKFIEGLSGYLPASLRIQAMRKARAHAGGKMTRRIGMIKTEVEEAKPTPETPKKSAGSLDKSIVGYRTPTAEESAGGYVCAQL